jgi:hypothetical protein
MPADQETAVAPHETPQTDHTLAPAKMLTIGPVVWLLVGGLAVLGAYAFLLRG